MFVLEQNVRLRINKLQMTLKLGKNQNMEHEPLGECALTFIQHFDVIYNL